MAKIISAYLDWRDPVNDPVFAKALLTLAGDIRAKTRKINFFIKLLDNRCQRASEKCQIGLQFLF